jgi:hypothetical protein
MTPAEKMARVMKLTGETPYAFLKRVYEEQKGYEAPGHILTHHANEYDRRHVAPLFVADYFARKEREAYRLPDTLTRTFR